MNTQITDGASSLWHGLTTGLDRFMAGVPTVLGALLLLVIGWVIAGVLAGLVAKLGKTAHLDTVADRIKVNDFLQRSGSRLKASDILGDVVKWVVRLVFVEMAADQLGLSQVTSLITGILAFIPNILVALLVLGVGAFLAQLLGGVVRGAASEAGMANPGLLAKLASGAVIAFAIIAAVNQLGIAPVVVNTLYIGLVAALSLALGLAFGLGGRDTAARLTQQWVGQAEQTAVTAQAAAAARPKPDAAMDSAAGLGGATTYSGSSRAK